MKTRIYHNPHCSKSRATLKLLEKTGTDLEIIEYLKTPPSKKKLKSLIRKLGLSAKHLVRTGEPEFKAANISLEKASEKELVNLMTAHPKIIERPIVEVGEKARIGRPPENILELVQ